MAQPSAGHKEIRSMKIPITKPFFGPEELRAVQLPLESGWLVQGPHVKEFEAKFAKYIGIRHAAASSSCTTALHMAVAVLGLKPGDEVIVPGFTWVATANVVEYMGAKPVFCDIDLQTFNINPSRIEALITPRTVGIIPVHLFGLCAEMEPILQIARKRRLWVVEDAACGLGAWYRGRHSGTFGEMGCFSFHPRKSVTTGEGGMVTTNNETTDRAVRTLRDHGASRSDLTRQVSQSYLLADYDVMGYNYRMTDLQGALGSVQMDRVEWVLQKRRERAGVYNRALSDFDWLIPPTVPNDCVHGYQSYVTLFCPEEPKFSNVQRLHERRNALMARLEVRGIATRQGTHAPVILGYYRNKYNLRPEEFSNAYIADRLSLSLPLYAQMTDQEQEMVIEALRQEICAV